jgi:hypothetical protein
MEGLRLFHVSEDARIRTFVPRPSPSQFDAIRKEVVFAISERLLHNYLLPRDCPRVCYYAGSQTSPEDRQAFLGQFSASFVIAVENRWIKTIERTTLFLYEFPAQDFWLLDENAGYYISEKTIVPVSVRPIYNILEEMLKRDVELRFMPSINELSEAVSHSSLNFSLIRMRNSNGAMPVF